MLSSGGRTRGTGPAVPRDRLVLPLRDVRPADVAIVGRAAEGLARLSRAGLAVRPGVVVAAAVRDDLAPGPDAPGWALVAAGAALGVGGAGGLRITVHPVLGEGDPLPPYSCRPARDLRDLRAALLVAWRAAGPDRALLVQLASPPPQRAGWAFEAGSRPGGPVLVAEGGPFVAGSARPPAPRVLAGIGRSARWARAVLGEPCDVGWVATGADVELLDMRLPGAR